VAGHFSLRSLWAKFGVAVFMIPVAIVDNALRIVGLSLLANYVDKSVLTDGRLHDGGILYVRFIDYHSLRSHLATAEIGAAADSLFTCASSDEI
jgi:exosortase/archaeosortase family protein